MRESWHCLDCNHFYAIDEDNCPDCGSLDRSYWDYWDIYEAFVEPFEDN